MLPMPDETAQTTGLKTHSDLEERMEQFRGRPLAEPPSAPPRVDVAPQQPAQQTELRQTPGVDVRVGSTAPGYLTNGDQPEQPTIAPEHRMTIQNGPWTETVVFQNGKAVRTEYPKGPNGQEILPPWKIEQQQVDASFAKIASDLGLQPDQMRSASALAQLMTPPPLLTGNPRIDSIAIRQYRRDLSLSSQRALAEVWKEGRMQKQNEAIMAREKFEQEQIAARQQKMIDVKAKNRYANEYRKHFDAIQKEIDEIRKDPKGEAKIAAMAKDPAQANRSFLWDREAHIAEARSRAQAATLEQYPEWKPDVQGQQPPGVSQDQAQAAAYLDDLMQKMGGVR